MAAQAKILAFAGSLRKDSCNKKLLKIAVSGAENAGAEVHLIDLKNYPLPIYDQDIEDNEGIPDAAVRLKQLLRTHDGFMIASPEYNSSISGALKNTIDWTTRPESENEPFLDCWNGKYAVLMSASPSNFGGMRGLVHLRAILGNIGVLVLPKDKSISQAYTAFTDSGQLKSEKDQKAVIKLGEAFADFVRVQKDAS